jgi:hypothetical protein
MNTMTIEEQLSTVGGLSTQCGLAAGLLAVAVCDPLLWAPLLASSDAITMGMIALCA